MAQIFEIPLTPIPQKLTVNLNGIDYIFALRWNTIANYWILDIFDSLENKILVGIPLVTGKDLLGQFRHLQIGANALLITVTDKLGKSNLDDIPTKTNLGIDSHLYYLS